MPSRTSQVVIEDPHVVAFLSFHSPDLSITPQLTFAGRVAFAVSGSDTEIQTALKALEDNVPIGSRDLLEVIKRTRTKMFAFKLAHKGVS